MLGLPADYFPIASAFLSVNQHSLPQLQEHIQLRILSAASAMRLKSPNQQDCINLFRYYLHLLKTNEPKGLKLRPRIEFCIAACVLIVARIHRLPISSYDAAAWLSIDHGSIMNAFYGAVSLMKVEIIPLGPEVFFPRIMKVLGISDVRVEQVARKLFNMCIPELILIGRPSPAIAAALLSLSYRAIHRNLLQPEQVSAVVAEINMPFQADVDYVLASSARLAYLLPFNVPLIHESIDMYLPELLLNCGDLIEIATNDEKDIRSCGPLITNDVILRILTAKSVVRVCGSLSSRLKVYAGDLPINIYDDKIQRMCSSTRPHVDEAVETLIRKGIALISILNGDYSIHP